MNISIDTVTFDDEGDVELHVGLVNETPSAIYTACSRALSRASCVFEDLFYGKEDGQKRGTVPPNQPRHIELPHDEPVSMAIFLYIIHSRFDQVPDSLSLDDLYNLVIVAHKYSATAVLRPWTAKWTQSSTFQTEAKKKEEMLKAIGIYWVLGCREDFFRAAQCLVESTQRLTAADVAIGPIPLDVAGKLPEKFARS